MKRIVLFVMIGLLVMTSAFANGGDEAASTEMEENVMIAALDNGPGGNKGTGSIPYSTGAGNTLIAKLYTPLTIFDEKYEDIIPAAAQSWESNADKTVWTFKLADGLTWSDGKAVTAQDVKFTVEFTTDPQWVAQTASDRNVSWGNLAGFADKTEGKISELSSVKVLNDSEIQFTLAQSDPRFYAKMFRSFILPEHAIDFAPAENMTTDWWWSAEKQVGSGPFHISGYEKDDYLELMPNENYYRGKPELDKLIVKFFASDDTAAILALAAGDIDFSYIEFNDIASLGDKVNVYSGLQPVPRFFMYNFDALPDYWKDIRVRQAIYHAIDRETITAKVYNNTHEPVVAQVLSKATWSDSLDWYEYNPEKSKQLLAAAGVDPGDIVMDVIGYKGDPMTLSAMQAVQNYLAQIGITQFSHVAMDGASYRSKFKLDGDWAIVYRGAGGDPYTLNTHQFYDNAGVHGGDFAGYDYDPEFKDIINRIDTADSTDGFFAALTEYNDKANELATMTYLWAGKAYGAAGTDVKNFHWYPGNGGGPYEDHAELWTKE
jgi:peptide/nickel transport system substrate-binding protein